MPRRTRSMSSGAGSSSVIRELVRAEAHEGLAAARQIDKNHTERAATLRAEASVLADLLGDV